MHQKDFYRISMMNRDYSTGKVQGSCLDLYLFESMLLEHCTSTIYYSFYAIRNVSKALGEKYDVK